MKQKTSASDSIHIQESTLVAPKDKATQMLAQIASSFQDKKKTLDLGCASGYIAIALAKKGFDVVASDISDEALALTQKNAEKNNVNIKTVKSDLFESLNEKFDMIIFNPPVNEEKSSNEHMLKAVLKGMAKITIVRKLLLLVSERLLRKQRRALIHRFFSGLDSVLSKGGVVIVHIFKKDAAFLVRNKFAVKYIDSDLPGILGIYKYSKE